MSEEEKFCDNDMIYNIKIRGQRDVDKCYFSVKDVTDVFDLPNLIHYLIVLPQA